MISKEEQRLSGLLKELTDPVDEVKAKIKQSFELLMMIYALNNQIVQTGGKSEITLPGGKPTKVPNIDIKVVNPDLQKGFSALHSQAMVSLWTLLESAVYDAAARWIEYFPEKIDGNRFRKIKVNVVEFKKMDVLSQNRKIVDLIIDECGLRNKFGAARFCELLKVLDLKPKMVHETINRDLIELHQFRNAIIHHGSKVDVHTLEACTWMNLKLGQAIKPNMMDVLRYRRAAEKCFDMVAHSFTATIKPMIDAL